MPPIKQILSLPFDFIKSFFELFFDKKLFGFLFIPWMIGTFFFLILISLGFYNFNFINEFIFRSDSEYLNYLFYIATSLLIFGTSAIGSIILVFIFAEYTIEKMIVYLCSKYNLESKSSEEIKFMPSLLNGITDNLRRLIFLIISLSLLLIFSFFPPLLVIWYILSSFLAGYELLDLPLQVQNFNSKERFNFYFKNKTLTTLAGAFYLITLLIPVLNIIALQASYVFGIKILKKLNKTD